MDTVVLKLWNMVKIMKVFKIAIFAGTAAAAFVLAGCGDGGTGPDNSPAFGNVSNFEPLYLAYLTNDPIYKPDTIKASFDYNSSKVKSIEISITLDTGKSWVQIALMTPQSSNKASIAWAPLSDAANFGYFGGKQCFLKIEDPISKNAISTDSFIVVGNIPSLSTLPKAARRLRFPIQLISFFPRIRISPPSLGLLFLQTSTMIQPIFQLETIDCWRVHGSSSSIFKQHSASTMKRDSSMTRLRCRRLRSWLAITVLRKF